MFLQKLFFFQFNISIFYFINLNFAGETIQGRKLFKGGNYMRKYGGWLDLNKVASFVQ